MTGFRKKSTNVPMYNVQKYIRILYKAEYISTLYNCTYILVYLSSPKLRWIFVSLVVKVGGKVSFKYQLNGKVDPLHTLAHIKVVWRKVGHLVQSSDIYLSSKNLNFCMGK